MALTRPVRGSENLLNQRKRISELRGTQCVLIPVVITCLCVRSRLRLPLLPRVVRERATLDGA